MARVDMIELSEEMYKAYTESHAADDVEVDVWKDLSDGERKAWAAAAHRAMFRLGVNPHKVKPLKKKK